MSSPSRQKLRVALIGCGRQGKVHARNFALTCPNATLVAVVDPFDAAHQWVRSNISDEVVCLREVEDLYRHFNIREGAKPGSGDLDAVVIASSTDSHAPLCVSAARHGLHVLLEKPVAIDLPSHKAVIDVRKQRPDVKIVVALSRRFDPSYRQAIARARNGELGSLFAVRSATVDLFDESGWFIPYSEKSGGIFIDCGIHDIDIARWFLGLSDPTSTARVSQVYAVGLNACHPELSRYGDVDNAFGMVQLNDGRSFNVHLGRTAIHGHEAIAEVHGTKGRVIVNQNPTSNRNTILDQHGVRTLSTPSYMERFEEAFVNEAREFVDHCLHDAPIPVTLDDAVAAAQIATGLTWSLRAGEVVKFDDEGRPIMPNSLRDGNVGPGGWALSPGGEKSRQAAMSMSAARTSKL